MFAIALGAILVTAAGSLLALGLNALTDDWFACIAFVLLWCAMAALLLRRAVHIRLRPAAPRRWNLPLMLFWAAMYLYCLIACLHLRLPFPLLLTGVLFISATLYLSAAHDESYDKTSVEPST